MTELLLPLRDLLEFNLATYVQECSRSKPKQKTLNALEKVLTSIFMTTWAHQAGVANAFTTPHLFAILSEKLRNAESAEFAIARFFLKYRYPKS